MLKLQAGETALIAERGALRWVRVVLAAPVRADGTQALRVIELDTPHAKPRPVVLGRSAKLEYVS